MFNQRGCAGSALHYPLAMPYADEQINRERDFVETDPFTAERYRLFARELGADFAGEVLDVGCGVGQGGVNLKKCSPSVTLDGSELMHSRIDRIPEGVYRAVYPGLMQDIPTDVQYDAVLAGEVIEHVPLPHLEDFVGSIHSRLRRGGLALLTTPNPHYFLLKWRSGGSVLGGAHVSVHCPRALVQYLNFSGFKVRRLFGTGRMTRYLGRRAPLPMYGSFFLTAQKM